MGKDWDGAVGASFAVWAVTFTGLLLLVIPNYSQYFDDKAEFSYYLGNTPIYERASI